MKAALALLASTAPGGFTAGALLTALGLGFRHGIDWDHIAAITDISSSQDEVRRSLTFGTLYVLGHAGVVFALGVVAIIAGDVLPETVDEVMTKIVGVTLVVLGVYVFVSLIRHGRDFRLRSRWMLIFSGVRRGMRWLRRTARPRDATTDAPDGTVGTVHAEDSPELWHHGHHGRPGHHHHEAPERDEALMSYGSASAFGVGMIHGIGAETATQILVFLAAAGAGGAATGVLVLGAFIVGLVASNTVIVLGTTFGFLRASRNFPLYATVAVVTGVLSLVIGTLFLLGKTSVLPVIFSG